MERLVHRHIHLERAMDKRVEEETQEMMKWQTMCNKMLYPTGRGGFPQSKDIKGQCKVML